MDYIVWDQKLLKRYMEKRPPVLQAFNEYFIKQLSSKLLSTMKTYERCEARPEGKGQWGGPGRAEEGGVQVFLSGPEDLAPTHEHHTL